MTSQVTVTRHWLRIYTAHVTHDAVISKLILSKLFELICTYFDDDDDEDEEEPTKSV